MKTLIIIFGIITLFIILFFSCVSYEEPIIINDIPTADLSDDMTIQEYMKTSTKLNIDLKTYIDELINQIKYKLKNVIDLRKKSDE